MDGISVPFLVSWMLLLHCWKISLPDKSKSVTWMKNKKLLITRPETWAFFETFVVSGDNWLPPDNYRKVR